MYSLCYYHNFFTYLLFARASLLQIFDIQPLITFSINKLTLISEIVCNFTPVIFNIASKLNPGALISWQGSKL